MKRPSSPCSRSLALALPTTALAHPLGNFTVNRYSEIALSGDRIYVRYALDLAEIPTYQEGASVRAPGFAGAVAERLVLELDGRRVVLTPLEHRVQTRPGAGGLETLRFDAVFAAPAGAAGKELGYRDLNFERRLGWREIVVVPSGGAEVLSADVPSTSASDALRSYPADLLSSPLDVRSAQVEYEPGSGPGHAPAAHRRRGGRGSAGGFESLIARGDLGVGVILASLLVAMLLGRGARAHARPREGDRRRLPGRLAREAAPRRAPRPDRHRDAYRRGVRPRPGHAPALPLHRPRAAVPLADSRVGDPRRRRRARRSSPAGVRRAPAMPRPPPPPPRTTIALARPRTRPRRAPRGRRGRPASCRVPSALVVLLSAIALHRVGFGLALIVAFSIGLAATITTIGLLAVLARRAFGRLSLDGRLVRALPAASALLILAVGVGITVNALPEVL